ncbi:hypothetical protein C8J25_103352 [Sphingomonas faeni]|uniref:Uncharacterized protein n=1 Tax=Sphingomonas faeni TaxID=185950 RepID=A0A2T5U808_9SPHN|nr:hypothetical protein [Sphingomonas faeni]PTW47631.1 hypothetical protein C8J25_103352 [Sphingomonas faeni]
MGILNAVFNRKPQPDFYFAAKGFMFIAVLKREGKDETYLRRQERLNAIEYLKDGYSEHQALSARWGGCLAIEDDLVLFETAIKYGKVEATEIGDLPSDDAAAAKEIYRAIYHRSADFAVRAAWEADRTMYRRFLNFIQR